MVFVSHMAYGTLEGIERTPVTRRGPRILAALGATVILGVACLGFVAFEMSENSTRTNLVQRTSDSFLFKTPTLRSLVGTFMTEQGADKKDISEVDNYYSSKKAAKMQMLDDISSEFDPFTDADSNYGRVLSLKGISRTNGPVSEDMDTTGEFKAAHLQSLAWKPASEVIGAAFQPVIDAIQQKTGAPDSDSSAADFKAKDETPKSEIGLAGSSVIATKSAKAPTQALWGDVDEETDLQHGRRPFVKDVRQFRHYNKDWLKKKPHYWNKAKAQMLDDISSEFDPFTDADSNYGRVLSLKGISRTNGPVSEDMDTSGEFKAARTQQLYTMPSAFHDHAATGVAPLPDAGALGTNAAFLSRKMNKDGKWYQGVGDGAGQSTKARVQMLVQPARFTKHGVEYQELPEAGTMGTNVAFLNKESTA